MTLSIKSHYPRAWDKRNPKQDPVLKKTRKPFFKGIASNFLFLQVLFLGLFCYAFGSLFLQTTHVHNLGVVFVDYDGGAIGRAVRGAYTSLQGKDFPSLIERSPSEFPTTHDLREAVCKTRYWAAFYVVKGASAKLHEALNSSAALAAAYDNTNVMAYIWNEALYPTTVDSAISANLQLLSAAARVAYSTGNGTGDIQSVSGSAALSVLANPWELQSINIQPTIQGSRTIYNTVVIILILIQEFFYLGIINALYGQFKIYARVGPYRIIAIRNMISLSYTFIGSLCVIGTIFAFKSGWNINGNQFVLCWMSFWLFAHINFLVLDVFTIWLPPPFIPMALVCWIVFNVTSILLPFDLSPAFYRVGYMFPAHEVYQILTDIWSRGCNPQLHYALPILFAWEVLGLVLGALGVFRRCHFATLGEEMQAAEFQERIDAAVSFEMTKMSEMRQKQRLDSKPETKGESDDAPSDAAVSQVEDDEEALREQLSHVLRLVDTRQHREQERANTNCNFGPSFDLAFSHSGEDDS